jgi:hypothetical protein
VSNETRSADKALRQSGVTPPCKARSTALATIR